MPKAEWRSLPLDPRLAMPFRYSISFAYTHTHTHTHTHAYIYIYIHNTYIHTYTHTHTIYIYIFIHVYTYTDMLRRQSKFSSTGRRDGGGRETTAAAEIGEDVRGREKERKRLRLTSLAR